MKTKILLFINLITINCYGMQQAIESGNLQAVARLLNQGADVDSKIFGITLLNFAARKGKTAIAELLILRGANVDTLDNEGYSPLFMAITINDNHTLAQLLLQNGANPNLSSIRPITRAVMNGNIEIVKMLLDYKAKVLTHDSPEPADYQVYYKYANQNIKDLLEERKKQEIRERKELEIRKELIND